MKLDRILDGDGHVIERDAEIFEYLEPPYAGNTTLLGYPFFPTLDGYNRGAVMARLGIHHSYEITPQLWLDTLDRVGLELTVLYPTSGLAFTMIQDPEWAVALARAYNNWFSHRYRGKSKRLRGVALLPLQIGAGRGEGIAPRGRRARHGRRRCCRPTTPISACARGWAIPTSGRSTRRPSGSACRSRRTARRR